MSDEHKTFEFEYESSTSIPIVQESFETILNNHKDHRRLFIFYTKNGVRYVDGVFEKKTVIKKKNKAILITFPRQSEHVTGLNSIFLPITEKVSKEEQLCFESHLSCFDPTNITTVVIRYVLFDMFDDTINSKIRVCIEENIENGVSHRRVLTCEVEYKQTNSLYEIENKVFYHFVMHFYMHIGKHLYDDVNVINMMSFPSRKFLNIHKNKFVIKKDNHSIKKKLDGYKGRLCCNRNNLGVLNDDMGAFKSFECTQLSEFQNVVFQIEILNKTLDCKNQAHIVIVDVLGVLFKNKIHTVPPLYVKTFLEYFNNKYYETSVIKVYDKSPFMNCDDTINYFKLICQRNYIDLDSANNDRRNLPVDGYILSTDRGDYKLKLPTMDVHLKRSTNDPKMLNAYLDNNLNSIMSFSFDENIEIHNDKIYEISLSMKCVLRMRNERQYTSTCKEYEEQKRDLEMYKDIYVLIDKELNDVNKQKYISK